MKFLVRDYLENEEIEKRDEEMELFYFGIINEDAGDRV